MDGKMPLFVINTVSINSFNVAFTMKSFRLMLCWLILSRCNVGKENLLLL